MRFGKLELNPAWTPGFWTRARGTERPPAAPCMRSRTPTGLSWPRVCGPACTNLKQAAPAGQALRRRMPLARSTLLLPRPSFRRPTSLPAARQGRHRQRHSPDRADRSETPARSFGCRQAPWQSTPPTPLSLIASAASLPPSRAPQALGPVPTPGHRHPHQQPRCGPRSGRGCGWAALPPTRSRTRCAS